jgi:hypothetical protein
MEIPHYCLALAVNQKNQMPNHPCIPYSVGRTLFSVPRAKIDGTPSAPRPAKGGSTVLAGVVFEVGNASAGTYSDPEEEEVRWNLP